MGKKIRKKEKKKRKKNVQSCVKKVARGANVNKISCLRRERYLVE